MVQSSSNGRVSKFKRHVDRVIQEIDKKVDDLLGLARKNSENELNSSLDSTCAKAANEAEEEEKSAVVNTKIATDKKDQSPSDTMILDPDQTLT